MKKEIPIAIRKILEELAQNNNGYFKIEFEPNSVITFKDIDIKSNLFFKLERISLNNSGTTIYTIEYKPSNRENLNSYKNVITLDAFKGHFENWKNLFTEICQESPLFDDAIIQSYYDEIEPNFKIVDEDAEYKTYTINQQLIIVEFLNNAHKYISNLKIIDTDTRETLQLIENTKENISKTTKKQVVQNIRKIIATSFKIGLEVGQKLLIEFTTEFAKKMILTQ